MINPLVTNNWITILFVFMIWLLVIVNYFFENKFLKFRRLFRTRQYFIEYISITSIFSSFNILLLLFNVCCYSLLTIKVMQYYLIKLPNNHFLLFLKIASFIILFYLARYLFGKLFARILNLKRAQEGLSFVKLTHLSKTALIIFPFLILFHFFEYKNNLLFFILGIFTLTILLIKYVTILQQNQNIIISKWYYFILYLCILEILPLILVFKTLKL